MKKNRKRTSDFKKLAEEKKRKLHEDQTADQTAEEPAAAAAAAEKPATGEEATAEEQAAAEEKLLEPEAAAEADSTEQAVLRALEEKESCGDTTLRRGVGSSQQEKWRCTIEHRCIILHYLDPEKTPVGLNWKPALVVKTAAHCRLSNIDDNGRWLKDEQYVYGGYVVQRLAGKSAGKLLQPWLEARKKGFLKDWEVFGQPAAVVDSIIQTWMLQSQQESFPCSIWTRDMLNASQNADVQTVQKLCQQLHTQVKGGVTDLIQITDTDMSMSLKSSLRQAQEEERRRMKEHAKAEGRPVSFKCGVEEMARILEHAWDLQKKREEEKPWVLAAARRNGYLHWRPGANGELCRAGDEEWAKELPEGSYRYNSAWLEDRELFVQSEEKRKEALKYLKGGRKRAEQAELALSHDEGFVRCRANGDTLAEVHLEICVSDVEQEAAKQGLQATWSPCLPRQGGACREWKNSEAKSRGLT